VNAVTTLDSECLAEKGFCSVGGKAVDRRRRLPRLFIGD
jgi:hypothetical protein